MLSDYLGKKCKLKLVKEVEFGYYLGEEEDKVLLPKNEASDGVREALKSEKEVEVFLYKDSEDRLIATTLTPGIEIGNPGRLKVVAVTKIGAFLDWGLRKDLLLPFKEQKKELEPGDEILVALYVDKSERLCATMNLYSYLLNNSPYKKDDEVRGYVYEISDRFGTYVAVEDGYQGRIPAKEGNFGLKIGKDIVARITKVNEDGKLELSLRKKAFMQMDEDSEAILLRMRERGGRLPYTDKAAPEVIMQEFGFSKNAFKRAVGRLLKEGKIKINEKSIELL